MKKLFTIFMGIILLSSIIFAAIPMPDPLRIYIKFNGVLVEGVDVTYSCLGGNSVTETTNDKGGVAVTISNLGICPLLTTSCGDPACDVTYNTGNLDYPYTTTYELGEEPDIPEPEPEPDPEPEVLVEDKVNSNSDKTIALIEANYGNCVDVIITDSKLAKLFDGVIDFDTEDYDTHEELRVKYCIETSLDDVDFGLDPYVIIEEEDFKYCYVFDDLIPYATVEDDEELEIEFLSDSLEIISLSSSKMTIRHGELFNEQDGCVEGEEIDYNGLPITIGAIDNDFVYLSYNGESGRMEFEEIGEIGGIQIYVDESVPLKDKPGLCSIRIAEDIEEIIEDGDEYNELWDYSITEGNICIVNSEEYKYLDEANKPLTLGDKIVLPNDFAVIKVNEITSSDVTEIGIRVRDSYLNVLGEAEDSFTFNNEDYDELFVGAEGILDEDKIFISNKVRIGESNVYLEKGSIIIGDLVIELDFLDILYEGVSFASKEDKYLTYTGIIFKDPENSVNGHSTFDVIVPDEIPELIVTVGAESETIGIEPEPVVCDETECTEEECIETVCPKTTCPIYPKTTCPEEKTCPPVTTNLAAIIITGILGLAGGAGIFFKLFNNKIFLSSNTGVKMYRGRDGTLKTLHKHPGTRGYHNPQTSHRDPEKHPRGMIDVAKHYQKNSSGEWEYR